MRKYLFVLSVCFCSLAADAQLRELRLSDSAFISLLTCDAIDDMAYTLYGHTAVRVNDCVKGLDYVYNYGIFDFSSPNFLYRFARGELNYKLGLSSFEDFLEEYSSRKSGVTEQILNLTGEEKQKIFDALRINHLPENRTYLYSFLLDNCSTRPRILFENNISGTVEYPEILPPATFRTIIHHCNRNHRWLTFGIDLALGAPLDSIIGQNPQLFLPKNLMLVFSQAKIVQANGAVRDLVSETRQLAPGYPVIDEPLDSSPTVVLWLFVIPVLAASLWELRCKKHFRLFDSVLFFGYGLAGCMLFFLGFISIHPVVYPNFSIIWANPLLLVLSVLIFVKPLRKFVGYCMLVNGIILLILILTWHLFPQKFNAAFFPLVLILCIRSLLTVGDIKNMRNTSLHKKCPV
ncbi:MAG: DUF4105 domain-containing protein [Prevotellaceae bacterium]|jgi:hypothetical protein|nr:DUF4105 domain-containing protein [Prevotellaceae bacterium]